MLTLHSDGVLLQKTSNPFESQAVLNPGVIQVGAITHMFYRAVAPGNFSSIGYCQLDAANQVIYRHPEPILAPKFAYEQHGIEDPRIVLCDGIFYLFYVVYDGTNAQVAYATATELPTGPHAPHFRRHKIISAQLSYGEITDLCSTVQETYPFAYFCNHNLKVSPKEDLITLKEEVLEIAHKILWEKDAFIFPEKIHGKFALIHRILPEIQVLYFDSFEDISMEFWLKNLDALQNFTILKPEKGFESRYIGGGVPPIKTEAGWLFIYHAVEEIAGHRTYRAAAALLDLNDPTKVLGRLPYPLFEPLEPWELHGDVNNVVFPSGATVCGDLLRIYYGAADSCIGTKSLSLQALLQELLQTTEARAKAPAPATVYASA